MRRFAITVASVFALGGFGASAALANPPASPGNPAGTGQPSVSCPDTITSPKGFNSGGFANADTHYANPGTTPSSNPHIVSQYDVACIQTGQTH